jgi:hypothetical protein
MNWPATLENDLNFAKKRFEVEPFSHEVFGEGYLVFVRKEEAKAFRSASFALAIPIFSLDSYVFFLPKEPYMIEPKEIRVGKDKVVVHYPRVRAFDREGREIEKKAKEEAFILSGLSPFRSELFLLIPYELPYLLRTVQGRLWHKVSFTYIVTQDLSPSEGLEMGRKAGLKAVARKMLVDLVRKNPWLQEKVPVSLDHPVKSLWNIRKFLEESDDASLVEEILKR